MNVYKLYGIGNALLDYEYKINDEVLQKLKLEKGCMLLNDYDNHFKLHEVLKNIRPPEKIVPGGSVANSVYAMAQFDNKVCFSGKVSDDMSGNNFISCLNESNVETYISKLDKDKSGECLVLITPDNERTMNTFLGSSSLLSNEDINKKSLKESEYVLIEGYLVTSDQTLNVSKYVIELANEYNTKIVITLSDPNIVSFFRDNMLDLFKHKANIIFCNEQEALNFSQKDTIREAKDFLSKISDMFIITLGANGAICYKNGKEYIVDGIKTESKDFTGAGDMFLGAFMHAYEGSNILQSMEFANYCASKIISIFGAKFDSKDNYQNLMIDFKSKD